MILPGSRHGDVVLDPFEGSGTALLTANRLGRHG
ncbi:MAG: site-specific DNA-methyltransferase [Firmicutes bacterium]|nr:site-specific DNA-methyltransferase [Bacillota bacterium]